MRREFHGLNTNWSTGSDPYAREPSLTWLAGFTDPRAADPLRDGLVARWPFDESTGTVAHDVEGANDGTFSGATWTEGHDGGAISLSGAHHLEVQSDASLSLTSMTLAAWVRPSDRSSAHYIIEHASGTADAYALYITTGGNLCYRWASTATTGCTATTATVALNQWSHVAATFDKASSFARIYLNGALVYVAKVLTTPSPSGGPLTLGSQNDGGLGFSGRLDEVVLYDRALSAAEVNQLLRR